MNSFFSFQQNLWFNFFFFYTNFIYINYDANKVRMLIIRTGVIVIQGGPPR